MHITAEEARQLVTQQQIAHKLLAGLYQNLLKGFDRLASDCGFAFNGWWPLSNRPCQTRTNPSSRPAWDLLPLYAVNFEYTMQKEPEKARPGNCILILRLYCDEGFRSEYRTGYPDPVDLESRGGCVELILYRCIKPSSKTCLELYNEAEWPKPFTDGWQDVGSPAMLAYYKYYPLEYFITEPDSIKAHLVERMSGDCVVSEP